mgnify:CR=1 FL=1
MKTYLKDNNHYNNQYLKDDYNYVASLIDYFNVDFNEFRDSCNNLDTYLDECWILVENLNGGIIADVDGRCFGYTINQQSFFGITIKRTITLTEIFV